MDADCSLENKENFQLIWLDSSIDQSVDAVTIQERLRILNRNAKLYNDIKECIEFIQDITEEYILLILSEQIAEEVLCEIYNISSVRAVFLFGEVCDSHETLMKKYPSVIVDMFTDLHDLLQSIDKTMKHIEQQDASFYLFNRAKRLKKYDLAKESGSFIWHQLLPNILKEMPNNEQTKQEMLDYCTNYYRSNEEELKNIECFRTSYKSDKAIEYYTKNSFLYKLLNKALRTEDIGLLIIFRVFTIDLCTQLEKEKKQLQDIEPFTVYRAQQITKVDFEKFKKHIGSLIVTNGFLSASYEKRLCRESLNSLPLRDNKLRILIIIKVDPKLQTIAYADISHQSESEFGKQILFSLGTVFRIDACEFDEIHQLAKLTITATDEGADTLQSVLDMHKKKLSISSPLISFGFLLLNQMKAIDRAQLYFQILMEILPKDHPYISEVYHQMGVIHYRKACQSYYDSKGKDLALEMFEKALEIRLSTLGEQDLLIANSMNNIGSIYNDRGDYDRALEYYQRGLDIIENSNSKENVFKGQLLENSGILKQRCHEYEATIAFFTRADETYSHCLPTYHQHHADIKLRLADMCEEIGDFDRAFTYCQQTYEQYEVLMLPTESAFKELWKRIIRHCLKTDQRELAGTYLKKVLKCCKQSASHENEGTAYYLEHMFEFCENVLYFEMALNCYREYQKLKIDDKNALQFDILPENFNLRSTEDRISIINFKVNNYAKLFRRKDFRHVSFLIKMGQQLKNCIAINDAHKCCREAFDILEVLTLKDINDLWKCWTILTDICFENKDEELMSDYLERAVKMCKPNICNDYLNPTTFFSYIAEKYKAIDDFHNTLLYYDKAFAFATKAGWFKAVRQFFTIIYKLCIAYKQNQIAEMYLQNAMNVLHHDPVVLSECYYELSKFHEENEEKDMAVQCYKYFLLATELQNNGSMKDLDNIWMNFVFDGDSQTLFTERIYRLLKLQDLCDRQFREPHFKSAVISWIIGSLHEKVNMHKVALKCYESAIEIWEQLIYKKNDRRAKEALNDLLSSRIIKVYFESSPFGLANNAFLQFQIATQSDPCLDNWKCIIEHLKILKMAYVNSPLKFHTELTNLVLDYKEYSPTMQKILEICNHHVYDIESDTTYDDYSIICCLELISHWYLENGQYLKSLFYRQNQMALEKTYFSDEHSHIGWSLWFIGLTFRKMNEFRLSLDYFTEALEIFKHINEKEDNIIQTLEQHILQLKKRTNKGSTMNFAPNFGISDKRLEKIVETLAVNYDKYYPTPPVLQASLHFD